MSQIIETIDVDVPVRVAYNQWTQFEDFPSFMEGVESVQQIDDQTLHWIAEIGGQRREWDAKITEQIPDQKIAWYGIGEDLGGAVTFHRLDDGRARITLQMDFSPDDLVEKAGDALGIVRRRVTGDLERFKGFIESSGRATGAWRGEIKQDVTG